MSRIGRTPITIPKEAKVTHEGARLGVKGPNGEMSLTLPDVLTLTIKNEQIHIARANDLKQSKALHGLYRALTANMIHGVCEAFRKELAITGVGYRAQVQGQQLVLNVGYSHPVTLDIPEGITVEAKKPTVVVVSGCSKQAVGQFAADVRGTAPPEPYKGKGVRYAGEVIRRKAGKAATGAKGGG